MACLTWEFIISVGKTCTTNRGMRFVSGTLSKCSFATDMCDELISFLYDPQMAAFQQFLNASRFGHVAASVEAAWYLSTGSLEGVSQDVERAVM